MYASMTNKGEVRMLPNVARPESSLAWLSEVLSTDEHRAVMVIAMDKYNGVDVRMFGEVRRFELCWVAALLNDHAIHGEFEVREDSST